MLIVDLPHKFIKFGSLTFTYSGGIAVSTRKYTKRGETTNRFAVLGETLGDIIHDISRASNFMGYSYRNSANVYVEPEVALSRNVIRNSGYNIKRDISNSDYTVIPDVENANFYSYYYEFACYVHDDLYLFQIRSMYNCKERGAEKKIQLIRTRLAEYFSKNEEEMIFSYDDELDERGEFNSMGCILVPNVESYKRILQGDKSYKYISELRLPVTPTTEISVETLNIWRNMDNNTLDKMICASDWANYPYTLYNFLSEEKQSISYGTSNNLRTILKSISFFDDNEWETRLVTPKDFNMLQSYIMSRMGIKEGQTTALVTTEDYARIGYRYRNLIQKRLVVKSLEITDSITGSNIRELLRK